MGDDKLLKALVSKETKLKFAYACLKHGTNMTDAMRTMALAMIAEDKRASGILKDYDGDEAA